MKRNLTNLAKKEKGKLKSVWPKLALSALLLGGLVLADVDEVSASTDSYIQTRLNNYATKGSTTYFYTGYFSIHGGNSNTVHRWGRFDAPTPGLTVQSSMYNPVAYNYQANNDIDMYSPVQDWGFTPSNTRWHGSVYHVASGPGAGWQRSAKVDYTRNKTVPVANGVTITGADYVNGNHYWIQQGGRVQARVHGYQNFNGHKWRWDDWVSKNFLRMIGEDKNVRASMNQGGTFESVSTSSHVTLSRNAHSRPSGNRDLYSTFNVQGNFDSTRYEFQTYAESNNGRTHGYVNSGKYLNVDGTIPRHNASSIGGARHVSGNDYWVRPGDRVTVLTSGFDDGSRIAQTNLRIHGSDNDVRGRHRFSDAAGEVSTFSSVGGHVSMTSGSRVSTGTTMQYRFNVDVHNNAGNRTFNVAPYFIDNVGNAAAYTNSGLRIRTDDTAPTITANTTSSSWGNSNVSVALTHADGESGVATRQFAWSTSTSTPSSWSNYSSAVTQSNTGTWYLHARAVDNVGRVTTERFGPYRIDKTLPTGTISGNPTSWTNGNVVLSLSASDAGGSGYYRTLLPNGTYSTSATPSFTATENGTYTFTVFDNAGNSRDVSATVNRIDKTAPNGTISGNPTAWQNTNATLTFNATDTGGAGVNRVRVSGGSWVNGSTVTQTATANGSYSFEVEDNAGNTRTVSATVNRIDKTAPNGTVSGNPTSWTNSNATLTFNATDTGGAGIRRVRIAGGTWVNGSSVTQTATANGTFSFEAEDNAGNTRTVTATVNRIDKTLPTGSISGNPTSWTNGNAVLSLTAADTGGSGYYRTQLPNGTYSTSATPSFTATANGSYTFTVFDHAGNSRDVSVTVNRIDKTLPTGTISGNPTAWTNSNVTLSLSTADTGGSGYYRTQLPNGNYSTSVTPTFTVTENGTYTFTVFDNAGNSRAVSATVNRMDKTDPNGTITGNPTAWQNTNATLTFNATDSGGAGVRRVRIAGGTWVNGSSVSQTATANGTFSFEVEDNAGNTRTVSTTVNRIDKTDPNGTISGNPTSWQNTNATLTFNATDSGGAGVRRVRIAGGTWVTGATVSQTATANGTFSFEVEDNAGNTRTVSATVNRIDKTLPTGTVTGNPTSWTNGNAVLTLTAADTGGSGYYRTLLPNGNYSTSATPTFTVTANGTYTFTVYDHAGNSREVPVTVNRIDKTLPTGTISGNPTAWTNQNVTLTLTAADTGGSGYYRTLLPNGTYSTSATPTFTVTANGTYTFTVFDHAGNSRDVSATVNRIDKTDPNGTISGNPTSWQNTNATLTFNATDSGGAGVRRVRIAGGTWVNGSTTTQIATANGSYSFEVEDNAGNTRTVSVTVNRIDKTDPNGTITGNPTAWQNTNATLTFNATDSGGAGVRRVRIAGGTWVTGTTTTQVATANGTYSFEVEDNAGNTRTVSVAVNRIDKTDPSGTITGNPTVWQNTNATLTFNATDTGGAGVRRVRIAGGTWVNGATVSQTATANGTYSFEVEDHAGNTRTVSATVNRIDKTLPTGTISGNPTAWTNANVTLSLSASDTGGSGYYRTQLPNGSYSTSATPTFVVSANGTYTFTVFDHAGNSRDVSATVNRIDKVAPGGSITGNPTVWQNTNATLTFNATDSGGSGVRRVRIAGGTWVTGTTTTQTATANGTYSFEVEDHAGNTTTISATVNRIDKTAPNGTIAKSPSSWTNQNVTLTLSPTDAGGSGYHRTRLPDGTFTTVANPTFVATDNGSYSFTVYDHAGNSTVVSTSLTTIDRVLPTHVSTTVYDARYVNGNDYWFRPGDNLRVKIDGRDTDSQMRYNYLRFSGDGNDNRALHDWNGSNTSAVNEFSKGEFTEITSGVRNGYGDIASYTFNGSVLSNAGNRTFNVQHYFTDKAGNVVGYGNSGKRVRTDATAPSITANTTSRAWGNTNVTVALTHADAESGIATRQFAWSTSTTTPTSWNDYSSAVTQSSNGIWYLHARAVDNVGRVTTERFGPYRIDKTAPTLAITGNPTSWVGTDVTLSIVASDTGGSGVKEIILPNGNRVTQTSVTYTVPQNTTLTFRVIDHAGNETSYTIVVNRIDKVNPTASITPSTTTWTNQNVTLTINTQDVDSGIREIVRPDGSKTTSATTTFSAPQNGTYTFRVVDNVGNTTIRAYTVTNIDKEPPSETIVEIAK